ncbi:MAG: hypothetical protein GDA56_11840 [Hormoscilla sp. GM7CHS1pb]|nr:hypothetical protein [Hormoscilla sp. GM7CHS1pb]
MSTYNQVLSLAKNLSSSEQLRLLSELALQLRDSWLMASDPDRSLGKSVKSPFAGKNKWRGFLPERVDALEFQRAIRREWGE